uniref:NADH-ubiquinone oxidoreductase chain 4 n=2 Tax=Empoasca vitis TaxID=436393 RepID=A0A077D9K5_EMPVT|nr:NADH dehydrogenase subunit 4 [Empoasca vitis]AIL29206.1 NADH dehydrogenase subunit 4 [Empoasca vitis]
MMTIMFMIFMIPLCINNMSIIIQFLMILIMIMYMLMNSTIFFSSVSYCLGADFMSYGLIILTIYIISLMIISVNKNMIYMNLFLFVNLILCLCLVLIFMVTNLMYMYMFFEFSLIPLLIMVFGWGYQPERLSAGLYLFFYTLMASLPLLLFFIYMFSINGNLFVDNVVFTKKFMFLNVVMLLAFLVKLPMFMFHFWLPKAHVQAPVFGSMILAGLLLKIGGYGIIRLMFMCEELFLQYNYIWFTLSLIGSFLVSLICLTQTDVKSMIAFSSVAHMAMCIMSMMTMSNWGLFGTYMLMLSHGLCSSALFCLITISYERYKSRSFFINKGLQNFMPSMSMFWFLMCAFNMSCPPSLNFISEIFILTSMISYWFNSFLIFMFISFLSACFSFFLFSFTQHGNFHYMYSYTSGFTREYLLLMMHLLPIVMILLMMNFIY